MRINFLLTGEGVSDLRLVEHIENILINEGFSEVSGEAPDLSMFVPSPGRSVTQKISALLKHYPNTDIIFIHRDADELGLAARENEILEAAGKLNILDKVVPVVPVRALETWLLADLALIKEIAGNADLKAIPKCFPKARFVESISDPKKVLLDVLCEISCAQGAKLKQFKGRFGEMRARLTFGLDGEGPVRSLPSYSKFRRSIEEISKRLLDNKLQAGK